MGAYTGFGVTLVVETCTTCWWFAEQCSCPDDMLYPVIMVQKCSYGEREGVSFGNSGDSLKFNMSAHLRFQGEPINTLTLNAHLRPMSASPRMYPTARGLLRK